LGLQGIQDARVSGTDTLFAGGVKQDDDCAKLVGNKAPIRTISSWSTSRARPHQRHQGRSRHPESRLGPHPAEHDVAFEFNQNSTPCSGANHTTPLGSLVPRSTANGGDLLILYDFEGGNDVPTIRISRWTSSGWTAPVTLTNGQAEAKVNRDTSVTDDLAPPTAVQRPSGSRSLVRRGSTSRRQASSRKLRLAVRTSGTCWPPAVPRVLRRRADEGHRGTRPD
jgi:hypothetical protein